MRPPLLWLLVHPYPTPRLFERRLIGRDYARIGEPVKPVRCKARAGIALEVSVPQQLIDQGSALAPARGQAYADCRWPHLHVWGTPPYDLLSHVHQHLQGIIAHVYPPIIYKSGPLTRR